MKTLAIRFQAMETVLIQQTETAFERMRGLLGRSLGEVQGLWIIPCNTIHTIGMKYPLDLVYLNKRNEIVKLVEDVDAWRFSGTLTAHSVVEFAAGFIQKHKLSLGDTLHYECINN